MLKSFICFVVTLLLSGCGVIPLGANCDYSGNEPGVSETFRVKYTNGDIFHPIVKAIVKAKSLDSMIFNLDSTKKDTVLKYIFYEYAGTSKLNLQFASGLNIHDSINVIRFKYNVVYIGADPNIRSLNETECKNITDSNGAQVATFCTIDRCQ